MSTSQRVSAALGYIPVLGWIYAIFFRKDELVRFHLKQSIGLVLGMLGLFVLWGVVYWLLAWIPYGVVFGTALFALVIAALIIFVIAWVAGVVNALRGNMNAVPFFGSVGRRLPI